MPKVNRKGKAAIWTKPVIRLMRSHLKSPRQRLIFEISLFTGERMGAIVQLKVSDVYDSAGKVLDSITFAGSTRKSSKHGRANTRQIYIHDVLRHALKQYNAPPARTSTGLSPHRPLRGLDSLCESWGGCEASRYDSATSPPVSSSCYLFKSDRLTVAAFPLDIVPKQNKCFPLGCVGV